MTRRLSVLVCLLLLGGCAEAERLARDTLGDAAGTAGSDAAQSRQTDYETAQGQRVRLPLAGAAFADRVVGTTPARVPAGYGRNASTLSWPDGTGYTLGHGGSVTLEFTDNTLEDGPGADLTIFEFGPDVEATFVDISEDGRRFVRAGRVGGSESSLDISSAARRGAQYRFIRLTDDTAQGDRGGSTPGADIDAVGVINGRRR